MDILEVGNNLFEKGFPNMGDHKSQMEYLDDVSSGECIFLIGCENYINYNRMNLRREDFHFTNWIS
jgi:hypothetical protein